MKEIALTQGKMALVDDEDFEELSRFIWLAHYNHTSKIWYAQRSYKVDGERIAVHMHRVLMDAPDNMDVDHKDHNGLNNQRYNLRLATRFQNGMNRRVNKNNSCGFKGVTFNKEQQLWRARITVNGKQKFLGRFDEPEDAAHAYDEAAKMYFGEFANLNFG